MRSVFAYTLDHDDPLALYARFKNQPYSLFFDSADRRHPLSRYSFIAYEPFETLEARNGKIVVTNGDQQLTLAGDPFKILRQRLKAWGLDLPQRPDLPPFQGGAAGYFGYDLARGLESFASRTADNDNAPDMAVGLYEQVIAFDHQENKSWFIALAENEKSARAKYAQFRTLAQTIAPLQPDQPGLDWSYVFTKTRYLAAIEKVIDYIYAGDIFQANLSQRFEAALPENFDSFAHYCRLREINAAPFAAYMNFGYVKISSASPERFLWVRDRQVETRPIKGTRRRLVDPLRDAIAAQDLLASEKDRAENTMIVDLMRNDLSRVCEDFSINVPRLCGLESFAAVHHLVSIVTGVLRADKNPVDLLRACFPGGSITGAPKVRAMQIIDELEQHRRGPYCGAIGYIGFNGAMDTSIAIRTLVYKGNEVSFNTGGGIVADSDPEAEYQETMDKADAIFRSFGEQQDVRKSA